MRAAVRGTRSRCFDECLSDEAQCSRIQFWREFRVRELVSWRERWCPVPQVRAPLLGALIPRLRSGFRQRARTPAGRLNLGLVPQVRAPVLGANLGEGKSEALRRAPSVPDLALSSDSISTIPISRNA